MYLKQTKDPSLYWGLDIESNSLTPDIIWCVCIRNLKTDEERTFLDQQDFKGWLDNNPETIFVGHYILSFDIPVLNKLWGCGIDPINRGIDTCCLSYLYNPALENPEGCEKGPHSLEAYGIRFKYPKGDFNDWTHLSDEMIAYCQQDVRLALKVYTALANKMRKIGYSEQSCRIEHQIQVIINQQIQNGCWFDRKRAEDFREFLKQRQSDLAQDIRKLFPPERTKVAEHTLRRTKDGSPYASYEKHRAKYTDLVEYTDDEGVEKYDCYEEVPFNLGSPKQRIEKLQSLGWEPVEFTKKGNPKIDEDALMLFSEASGRPEIAALAEWLVVTARLTMLAGNPKTGSVGWLGAVKEDGRIHGKVFSCGAASRRMTHNTPNTANVPSAKKAKFGKEFRSFWGVEPGQGLCMVGYDAKGLETECFKHWLNSKEANKILDGDIHTDNAKSLSVLIGREVDREWGAKTSWYAWMFGCYPAKLAQILKCEMKYAEQIFEDLYPNRIPGLKKFIDNIQYEWKSTGGRLSCIDGGYVVCPSVSAALNYKIQPTGAVVMKLSSIILAEESLVKGVWNRKLLDVHDEGQHEAEDKLSWLVTEKNKKGEDVLVKKHPLGEIAVEAIREAGRRLKMNVSLDGSYAVGENWSMTH